MDNTEITKVITLQYTKAFDLMEKVISQYDEDLWIDSENYGDAAWQVAYHGLFYTNLYLAPSSEKHIPWSGEREDYHKLRGGKDAPEKGVDLEKSFSKTEMLDYLEHIRSHMETYLEGFEPEDDCWPYWYEEKQMEFHFNNLRHLESHRGALMERHDRIKNLPIGWR